MVLRDTPVYRFRGLLYELVLRDLTVRYRGSVLGFAWTLLNPLLFMGVYTLVFSVFMHSDIHNYPLFLLSGLVPWLWFSGAVIQATTCILAGSNYVGKTLMPAEVLILVPIISNAINCIITLALLFIFAAFLGVNLTWALVFLPLLLVIQFFITLGISLLVSAMNVFYRDLQQIVSYVLTAGFFLTPIFYSRNVIPHNLQFVVTYNPVGGLVSAYQAVFYHGVPPRLEDVLFASTFAVASFALGAVYFNSVRDSLGEFV